MGLVTQINIKQVRPGNLAQATTNLRDPDGTLAFEKGLAYEIISTALPFYLMVADENGRQRYLLVEISPRA